jgi:hypothetical protein
LYLYLYNMASDIILVQQEDGKKIDKPRKFAEDIRDVILKSNAHAQPASSGDGGEAPVAGRESSPGTPEVEGTEGGADEVFKVGLYKLTHSLKAAWFQPLSLSINKKNWF